jgi:hypothetical protein
MLQHLYTTIQAGGCTAGTIHNMKAASGLPHQCISAVCERHACQHALHCCGARLAGCRAAPRQPQCSCEGQRLTRSGGGQQHIILRAGRRVVDVAAAAGPATCQRQFSVSAWMLQWGIAVILPRRLCNAALPQTFWLAGLTCFTWAVARRKAASWRCLPPSSTQPARLPADGANTSRSPAAAQQDAANLS